MKPYRNPIPIDSHDFDSELDAINRKRKDEYALANHWPSGPLVSRMILNDELSLEGLIALREQFRYMVYDWVTQEAFNEWEETVLWRNGRYLEYFTSRLAVEQGLDPVLPSEWLAEILNLQHESLPTTNEIITPALN